MLYEVITVIGGRHPGAQHVCPHGLDHLLGGDHVAAGFRHLHTLSIDRETVRQHLTVRRAVVDRRRGQQGGLKPAAMLIRAFEVHAGGIPALARLEHAHVSNAGLEPDIEDIVV